MMKLCPKCNYFGKGKHGFWNSRVEGIFMLAAGSYGLSLGDDFFGTGIPLSLLMIIPIIAGIIKIVDYDRQSNICPNCNHKTMLSLDDPETLDLIKKYDLKLGNNPPLGSQNEPNPGSLETPK